MLRLPVSVFLLSSAYFHLPVLAARSDETEKAISLEVQTDHIVAHRAKQESGWDPAYVPGKHVCLQYFEGCMMGCIMPNLTEYTPSFQTTAPKIVLDHKQLHGYIPPSLKANFAAKFWANLDVVTGGNYTFSVETFLADVAEVLIDGDIVVSDGCRLDPSLPLATGTKELASGRYRLEVIYGHDSPTINLALKWQGPDTHGLVEVMHEDAFGEIDCVDAPTTTTTTSTPGPPSGSNGVGMTFYEGFVSGNIFPVNFNTTFWLLFTKIVTKVNVDLNSSQDAEAIWGYQTEANWVAHMSTLWYLEMPGNYSFKVKFGSADMAKVLLDGDEVSFSAPSFQATGVKSSDSIDPTFLSQGVHHLQVIWSYDGGLDPLLFFYNGPETEGSFKALPEHNLYVKLPFTEEHFGPSCPAGSGSTGGASSSGGSGSSGGGGSLYTKVSDEGACGLTLSSGQAVYHERCYCPQGTRAHCESMCTMDAKCKGYSMRAVSISSKGSCHLATTISKTDCLAQGCIAKYDISHVGGFTSFPGGSNYTGCYRKNR